ncbi:MAG: YbfB/YjiJ family MFS transporter [Rhodoferax sp.]|jgi:predicted MFS family arabinose efflux permease|nr:YbfB/YjiJ family MFS transporter [Rhodoferax sp.]
MTRNTRQDPGPAIGHIQVLTAGICSLILTVGIARFAYTPLLPAMVSQTGMTEIDAGWLATWNYLGYMSGALLAASLKSLHVKFQLFRIGLLLGVLSTVGMGMSQHMVVWVALRFVAGLSSAAGLLIGSGLVLNWLMTHGRKPELGIHFAGMGLGIVTAGIVVLVAGDLTDWRGQWFSFGALALLLLVPAWAWLPAPIPVSQEPQSESGGQAPARSWMRIMVAIYFCAGFGYVISATFTVAIMERMPALTGKGNLVWVVVGLAASPACVAWDWIARRHGTVPALLIAFGLQIVSFLMLVFSQQAWAAYTSAALYGATFIGIVSLTLTLIGRRFPTNPARAMARLTLSYGAAQVIAPAMAGYVAFYTGSYSGALLLAAVVMAVGMVLLMVLQSREDEASPVRLASA